MTSTSSPRPTAAQRSVALSTVVTVDRRDSATVRLVGELELSTADLLAASVDRELARGRLSLTVDVAGLGFLDCTGLRALVAARTRTHAAGGSFALTGVGPRTAWLLELTGLDAMLTGRTPTS